MDATTHVRSVVSFVGAVFAATLVTVLLLWAWQADAAPGDSDATLVPITPCRLIDTRVEFRVGPLDAFGPDETQTISAHGANGDCTIPTDAVGLSLNVTALDATQPSFLTIWPAGNRPVASSLNPVPGQPPIPNAVVTNLSGAGDFRIYNLDGSVQVIADVNGYYTKSSLQDLHARMNAFETAAVPQAVLDRLDALESEVTTLEAENAAQQAEIDALEAKTAPMSITTVDSQRTVTFTDVNVQIVSGSGTTNGAINGRGNLIVGYNQNFADTRTGSHNLIVGDRHSYSSSGGVAFGLDNTISGIFASVTGGLSNTASEQVASVSGGNGNTASGPFASVSGGNGNTASGLDDTVAGGDNVTCNAAGAVVCGEGSITAAD